MKSVILLISKKKIRKYQSNLIYSKQLYVLKLVQKKIF